MSSLTLLRQAHTLADPREQVRVLERGDSLARFDSTLAQHGLAPLAATSLDVLQVNVGRVCNQTCRHCHVDAGPDRRESMSSAVMQGCLDALRQHPFSTLDITGGAPEMNPHFRWLVEQARPLVGRIIDRCNLTILLAPGFDDLPEFLAEHRVEIVASLPCYLEQNVDAQRGDGVFVKSLEALRRLNSLGYGQPGSGLILNLVYNPLGPSLPPDQRTLSAAYHRELAARYGIVFHELFALANLPISRFLDDLLQSGRLDEYQQKLIAAFNPAAATGVMCRNTLSVDWQGRLFDCDFNQMLDLELEATAPRTIFEFTTAALTNRRIVTGRHCFGCTAGAGSSCQGAIAP